MRHNTVKQALRDGGISYGVMNFEFCTPGIRRISAHAGAQFIVYPPDGKRGCAERRRQSNGILTAS